MGDYFSFWSPQIERCKLDGYLKNEAQTFVVLYVPRFVVFRLLLPLVKLWNAVEGQLLLVLGRLQATISYTI